MAQFSMKIMHLSSSLLSENQQSGTQVLTGNTVYCASPYCDILA